ncbi:MAG: oligosaccharide flippase family protein [Balneolaceae bacterium]
MSQAQQMVKHSTIYAIGNISRQLVGFIMLPIYTNYLTPADYGVIGLLIFMVSLFEIVLGGHMSQAIPKFYHQEDDRLRRNSVVVTALLVTTFFSSIASLLMVFFSNPLSVLVFGDQEYSIYIVIFSALILTHALEQYGLTYLRIIKKPWTFLNFNMAKLALQLSLNILTIVILDWGLMGLALSSLISSVIISIALISYTLYKTGSKLSIGIAQKLLIFSWPLWVSGVIGLYIGSSNRYFIRIFSSLEEVGLYELATKFGAIVLVLVWSPFSQYWQTERYAIAKTVNPYSAYSLAFRSITALLFISGTGVIIFSSTIITIMSDSLFHPAYKAVPFLVIANIFQSLTVFNNFSFMHTGRTFEITKNNIVTAIVITIFYFALIPYFGFTGAAVAFALGSAIQYIYALYAGRRLYDLRISQRPLVYLIALTVTNSFLEKYTTIDAGLLYTISLKIIYFFLSAIIISLILFEPNYLKKIFSNIYLHMKTK